MAAVLVLIASLLAVTICVEGQGVNPTIINNTIFLLDSIIGNSSTITIGNNHGVSELKGSLDPSMNRNDLILDVSYASSGWVTIYHAMAPYLEHNSHIHFHAATVSFANIKASDTYAAMHFWTTADDSKNGTSGVLTVYFSSWFDYTQSPPAPIPQNKQFYFDWIKQFGTEWDLTQPRLFGKQKGFKVRLAQLNKSARLQMAASPFIRDSLDVEHHM